MQNSMLYPADVLIDVHPIGGVFGHGRSGGVRRCEPCVIPAGVYKRIHGVSFAPGISAAFRAGAVPPCRMTVKRIAGDIKGHIIGQLDRQICLVFRHHTASGTMDHRDRAAPIALARNAPIAQAVICNAAPDAARFAIGDGGGYGRFAGLNFVACKVADIAQLFRFHRNKGFGQTAIFRSLGHKNHRNWQAIFCSKVKIALVMCGAAENRTCAIVHQHKVCDINR